MAAVSRHVPLRRCRVCRTQAPKIKLARWIVSGGQLVPDLRLRLEGRGYYHCQAERCRQVFSKTIKQRER